MSRLAQVMGNALGTFCFLSRNRHFNFVVSYEIWRFATVLDIPRGISLAIRCLGRHNLTANAPLVNFGCSESAPTHPLLWIEAWIYVFSRQLRMAGRMVDRMITPHA